MQMAKRHREEVTPTGLAVLLPSAKWVHTLKLSRCVNVDDGVCALIASSCRNVRMVALSGCILVSDDGVAALAGERFFFVGKGEWMRTKYRL
jgi:hypothetical protein